MRDIRYPDKPLVFIHIPKTAGTSFTTYLIENMKSHHVVAPIFIGKWDDVGMDQRRHDFYTGHFAYWMVEHRRHLAGDENPAFHYVTFLRDPIARAISQWKSWHRKENLTPEWIAVMNKVKLEGVLLAQELEAEDFFHTTNKYIIDNISEMHTQYLADRPEGAGPPWKYPAGPYNAMYNLQHKFTYFGIVEEFEASMELFRRVFGGSKPYEVGEERENRSPYGDVQLSARTMKRIIDLNPNDMRVYDFACRVFEMRCKRLGIKLSENGIAKRHERWRGLPS